MCSYENSGDCCIVPPLVTPANPVMEYCQLPPRCNPCLPSCEKIVYIKPRPSRETHQQKCCQDSRDSHQQKCCHEPRDHHESRGERHEHYHCHIVRPASPQRKHKSESHCCAPPPRHKPCCPPSDCCEPSPCCHYCGRPSPSCTIPLCCKPVKTKYVIPCYRYEDGRILQERYVPTRHGTLPVSAYRRNGMQDQIHGYRGAQRYLCAGSCDSDGCYVYTVVEPLQKFFARVTEEMAPATRKKDHK